MANYKVKMAENNKVDYSFTFGPDNINFRNDKEKDSFFLKCTFNAIGQLNEVKGYIFLNEILDRLGINRLIFGQFYGYDAKDGIYIDYSPNEDGSFTINFRNMKNIIDRLEW